MRDETKKDDVLTVKEIEHLRDCLKEHAVPPRLVSHWENGKMITEEMMYINDVT